MHCLKEHQNGCEINIYVFVLSNVQKQYLALASFIRLFSIESDANSPLTNFNFDSGL